MPIGPVAVALPPGGSTWAYGFGCRMCAEPLAVDACCGPFVLGMP
jgi:hypothetical protein